MQERRVGDVVLNVGARRRGGNGSGKARAAIGEQGAVTRVPIPTGDELEILEVRAVENEFVVRAVVVGDARIRMAVVLHPLLRLQGAALRAGEKL